MSRPHKEFCKSNEIIDHFFALYLELVKHGLWTLVWLTTILVDFIRPVKYVLIVLRKYLVDRSLKSNHNIIVFIFLSLQENMSSRQIILNTYINNIGHIISNEKTPKISLHALGSSTTEKEEHSISSPLLRHAVALYICF